MHYKLDEIRLYTNIKSTAVNVDKNLTIKQLIEQIVNSKTPSDYEKLLIIFNELIKDDEQWFHYYNLGVLHFNFNDYEKAISDFEKALIFEDCDKVFVQFYLAKIYFKIENYQEAINYFKMIEKHQDFSMLDEVFYWLSEAMLKIKHYNDALTYSSKVHDIGVKIEKRKLEKQKKSNTIIMQKTEWDELKNNYFKNLLNRDKFYTVKNYNFAISCNGHAAWFCHLQGFHEQNEREYIELYKYPALVEIIEKFLKISPAGGRLHFTRDSVIVARTKEKLCYLNIE
ncbi:MAG: tetratricopeptide repeat protein [Candidatus Heimdallarchaeota archaeon]|nr:tetratricopeptide repeat protein [Candidatus Heimdallarchaeota archaeon]